MRKSKTTRKGGTATSRPGPSKANGNRVLPTAQALLLITDYNEFARATMVQVKRSEKYGWLVKGTGGYSILHLPEALECIECGIRNGVHFQKEKPIYFKLDIRTGTYVEDHELGIAMQNPESRRLQEMLADGIPFWRRYEQCQKEQCLTKAGDVGLGDPSWTI